jgi:hypothetical protein
MFLASLRSAAVRFESMWHRLPILLALAVLSLLGSAGTAVGAPLVWPVEGEVLTPYRNGGDPYAAGMHRGIDIAAPVGATVHAAAGGTATFAGRAPDGALDVTIRSRDGTYLVSHVHLASVAVRRGDAVSAGQAIGTVGRTGRPSSPQPHLHLGVRLAASRAYVDPLALLPPVAGRPAPGAPATSGSANVAAPVPAVRPAKVPRVRAVTRSVLPLRGERRSRAQPRVRGREHDTVPVVTPQAVRSQAAAPQRSRARSRTGTAAGVRAPGLVRASRTASPGQREALTAPTRSEPEVSSVSQPVSPVAPAGRQATVRGWWRTLGLLAVAGLATVLLWRRRSVADPTPRPVATLRAAAAKRCEQRA